MYCLHVHVGADTCCKTHVEIADNSGSSDLTFHHVCFLFVAVKTTISKSVLGGKGLFDLYF